jgi:hypothetical protein
MQAETLLSPLTKMAPHFPRENNGALCGLAEVAQGLVQSLSSLFPQQITVCEVGPQCHTPSCYPLRKAPPWPCVPSRVGGWGTGPSRAAVVIIIITLAGPQLPPHFPRALGRPLGGGQERRQQQLEETLSPT